MPYKSRTVNRGKRLNMRIRIEMYATIQPPAHSNHQTVAGLAIACSEANLTGL
jgi:hypothetical protein